MTRDQRRFVRDVPSTGPLVVPLSTGAERTLAGSRPATKAGGGAAALGHRLEQRRRQMTRAMSRMRAVRTRADDEGMATAEYAVATLAACGFAGLLVAVLSSGEVREMLLSIVKRALTLE